MDPFPLQGPGCAESSRTRCWESCREVPAGTGCSRGSRRCPGVTAWGGPTALLWHKVSPVSPPRCGAGGAAGGSRPCEVLYLLGGMGHLGLGTSPCPPWCPVPGTGRTKLPPGIKVYRRAVPSGDHVPELARGGGLRCGAAPGDATGAGCHGQSRGGLGGDARVWQPAVLAPGWCRLQLRAPGTVAVSPPTIPPTHHIPSLAAAGMGDPSTDPPVAPFPAAGSATGAKAKLRAGVIKTKALLGRWQRGRGSSPRDPSSTGTLRGPGPAAGAPARRRTGCGCGRPPPVCGR